MVRLAVIREKLESIILQKRILLMPTIFLIYADARVGIELFRHLRLSVDYGLPVRSFGDIYTTLNANIGWEF